MATRSHQPCSRLEDPREGHSAFRRKISERQRRYGEACTLVAERSHSDRNSRVTPRNSLNLAVHNCVSFRLTLRLLSVIHLSSAGRPAKQFAQETCKAALGGFFRLGRQISASQRGMRHKRCADPALIKTGQTRHDNFCRQFAVNPNENNGLHGPGEENSNRYTKHKSQRVKLLKTQHMRISNRDSNAPFRRSLPSRAESTDFVMRNWLTTDH